MNIYQGLEEKMDKLEGWKGEILRHIFGLGQAIGVILWESVQIVGLILAYMWLFCLIFRG